MTDLAECIEWMIGGRKLGVVAVGLVTHFVGQPGPDGPASGIVIRSLIKPDILTLGLIEYHPSGILPSNHSWHSFGCGFRNIPTSLCS